MNHRETVPQNVIQGILEKLVVGYSPQKVILFGSYAYGEPGEDSDIDLLIIKESKKPFLERLKEFSLMLPNNFPRVDVFIYTPTEFEVMRKRENPLVMKALQEGTIIYEAASI